MAIRPQATPIGVVDSSFGYPSPVLSPENQATVDKIRAMTAAKALLPQERNTDAGRFTPGAGRPTTQNASNAQYLADRAAYRASQNQGPSSAAASDAYLANIRARSDYGGLSGDAFNQYQTDFRAVQDAYRRGLVNEQGAVNALNQRADVVARPRPAATPVRVTPPRTGEGIRNQITPPSTGSAGMNVMGPEGRTYNQVTGTEYLSEAEMDWYREQTALMNQNGGQAVGPDGRTVAQIRGTPYLSDAEREWYFEQRGQAIPQPGAPPPAGAVGLTPRASISSSGGYWGDWGENNSYQGRPFGALGNYPYQGQSTFPPAVERWRELAEQYVRPEHVNKLLYVIQHESGGRPEAVGDGGRAIGLFQSHHIGTGASVEQMFADAARMIYR